MAVDPQRARVIHRALACAAFAACVYFAVRGVRATLRPDGSDFAIFHAAGRAVWEGRDPSSVHGFLYLPFYALCMVPFAWLPLPAAIVAWQLASLAALVWTARSCTILVRGAGLPSPAWLAWAPLVCVLRLVDSNFSNGQTNILVFAAVIAFLRGWQNDRPRRAGAWLALATGLKLVPGLFFGHLIVRRAWHALAAAIVCSVIAVYVAPSLVFGFARHDAMLAAWWTSQSAPYAQGGEDLLERREYVPGQSLTATAYRLLSATPATSRGAAGPHAEIVDLEPATVHRIVVAASIAYALLLAATVFRSRARDSKGAWLRECALVICAALTLAPLVHKAHMLWLILPFAVVLAGAPAELSKAWRGARWTFIALAVLLIGATTPVIAGRALATWQLSHNSVFFGLQALSVALWIDVWCARGPAAPRVTR